MFEETKLFALDLDGTIWQGDTLCMGALELVEFLQENYRVVFHTNSSMKTKEKVRNKLNRFGIDCRLDEIYTSASLTIEYLVENELDNLYIIGSDDFKSDLVDAGFSMCLPGDAEHLIVGMDKDFSYYKIASALQILKRGGGFIACNADANFPVDDGKVMPGCGAMVGAITGASGLLPYVVGKPHTYLMKKISDNFNVEYNEIVVIGDSYTSDIAMAQAVGCDSIYIGTDDISATVGCKNLLEVTSLIQKWRLVYEPA